MKRFSMFALLLSSVCVLGCEPPKPAATPPAATEATPATDAVPATDAPKEEMPAETK